MNAATHTASLQANAKRSAAAVYLPGLNGLRAIAAIAVLLSHITLALENFGLDSKIFGTDAVGNAKGLSLAGNGVTIFFTLSGFLITFLLMKEKELGKLNVAHFYARRALRIWPLYYLYLFLAIGTMFLFGMPVNEGAVPFYILLAANIPFITGNLLPLVAHFWSIGVEEQFYLFFPQIAKYSGRKLLRISLVLIGILLVAKAAFWCLNHWKGISMPLAVLNVTRIHIMLIGVVAALLYYYKNPVFFRITTHKLTQIVAWTSVLLMATNDFHIASVIDDVIISLVSVALIMGQVTRRNHIINLENKACDFIGKISYGIYVIHPLVIFYYAKILGPVGFASVSDYLLVFGLITATTIWLSYLSYEYFEKRFIRMKSRYTTVPSSSTQPDSEISQAQPRPAFRPALPLMPSEA